MSVFFPGTKAGRGPRALMACTSPRDETGGMEAIVRSVAQALREHGWEVVVAYAEEQVAEIDEQTWSVRLDPPRTRWKIPTPASVVQMASSAMALVRLLRRV